MGFLMIFTKIIDIYECSLPSNGVRKLLDGLDPYKASGPDSVSARLLKECSHVITDGIFLLFNAFLSQGKVCFKFSEIIGQSFQVNSRLYASCQFST